jgi:hypothetical protein
MSGTVAGAGSPEPIQPAEAPSSAPPLPAPPNQVEKTNRGWMGGLQGWIGNHPLFAVAGTAILTLLGSALSNAIGNMLTVVWQEYGAKAREGSRWPLGTGETCVPKGAAHEALIGESLGTIYCLSWTAQAPRTLASIQLIAAAAAEGVVPVHTSVHPIELKGGVATFIPDQRGATRQSSLGATWCDAREDASVRFEVWFTMSRFARTPLVAQSAESLPGTSACDITP